MRWGPNPAGVDLLLHSTGMETQVDSVQNTPQNTGQTSHGNIAFILVVNLYGLILRWQQSEGDALVCLWGSDPLYHLIRITFLSFFSDRINSNSNVVKTVYTPYHLIIDLGLF